MERMLIESLTDVKNGVEIRNSVKYSVRKAIKN